MELNLNRVDYNIVGLTSKKCTKVLPAGSGGNQKIVVGDKDGVLHIFSIKKSEIFNMYQINCGTISSVELGGPLNGTRDKIFVSSLSEVRGYTKKGKQFLGFDTNLTDLIQSIYVVGSDLFVCTSQTLHIFRDCQEAGSYICSDTITDVIGLDPEGAQHKIVTVISCADKTLKVLDGIKLLHTHLLDSVPLILELFCANQVLFGCSDGSVGCICITSEDLKSVTIVERGKTEITALFAYDLLDCGQPQLILGRDDGNIEVHTFAVNGEPSNMIYLFCCNESVSGLQAGRIGSPNYAEILVTTFSGWVFGLTTEVPDENLTNTRLSSEADRKIEKLRRENEELEEKILKEREKYQLIGMDYDVMSKIPPISIKDKFLLQKEDASYSLCLEVQTSIDNVLIQSEVPVDLLDVQKNSAVISFSECDPSDGNFLLATYRCQFNTTRLDLKLRTIEGQYGIIRAYVTPNLQPKCCQVREYRVKPLSLHTRIHNVDPDRPYNSLILRGSFSMAEMHAWIAFCLPEVPEKVPAQTQQAQTLSFASSFLDTMLQCIYSKGEAEFKSDNISTISILKDVLSKEATRGTKKRNIDINWDLQERSIAHTLSLIHPKLNYQLHLQRQVFILEGLSELDSSEGVSDDYSMILSREKEILSEFQQQPAYLDRLYGMITDLYIDNFKFQGIQVKHKIPALMQILSNNYTYENLLQFFYS